MSKTNYIERYWRDAKPEDAIKEPPMVARFRSGVNQEWIMDTLQGIDRSEPSKWRGKDVTCRFCQVYDAPDPGEGWRLIDIDKATKQPGDEYLLGGSWVLADNHPFRDFEHYRRRITPAVTYVPFTWEDREQLRGKWIKFKDGREVQCTKLEPLNNSIGMAINCYTPLELLQSAIFLDTKKPVGKEVDSAD